LVYLLREFPICNLGVYLILVDLHFVVGLLVGFLNGSAVSLEAVLGDDELVLVDFVVQVADDLEDLEGGGVDLLVDPLQHGGLLREVQPDVLQEVADVLVGESREVVDLLDVGPEVVVELFLREDDLDKLVDQFLLDECLHIFAVLLHGLGVDLVSEPLPRDRLAGGLRGGQVDDRRVGRRQVFA
jgi:hypothetical protein